MQERGVRERGGVCWVSPPPLQSDLGFSPPPLFCLGPLGPTELSLHALCCRQGLLLLSCVVFEHGERLSVDCWMDKMLSCPHSPSWSLGAGWHNVLKMSNLVCLCWRQVCGGEGVKG